MRKVLRTVDLPNGDKIEMSIISERLEAAGSDLPKEEIERILDENSPHVEVVTMADIMNDKAPQGFKDMLKRIQEKNGAPEGFAELLKQAKESGGLGMPKEMFEDIRAKMQDAAQNFDYSEGFDKFVEGKMSVLSKGYSITQYNAFNKEARSNRAKLFEGMGETDGVVQIQDRLIETVEKISQEHKPAFPAWELNISTVEAKKIYDKAREETWIICESDEVYRKAESDLKAKMSTGYEGMLTKLASTIGGHVTASVIRLIAKYPTVTNIQVHYMQTMLMAMAIGKMIVKTPLAELETFLSEYDVDPSTVAFEYLTPVEANEAIKAGRPFSESLLSSIESLMNPEKDEFDLNGALEDIKKEVLEEIINMSEGKLTEDCDCDDDMVNGVSRQRHEFPTEYDIIRYIKGMVDMLSAISTESGEKILTAMRDYHSAINPTAEMIQGIHSSEILQVVSLTPAFMIYAHRLGIKMPYDDQAYERAIDMNACDHCRDVIRSLRDGTYVEEQEFLDKVKSLVEERNEPVINTDSTVH